MTPVEMWQVVIKHKSVFHNMVYQSAIASGATSRHAVAAECAGISLRFFPSVTSRRPHSDEYASQLAINTIRTLSMEGVERANSGHPGTAMALAPAMYAVWQHDLKYDPADPCWPARDRFVLSVGHASMLLYSTLFLTGVKDIRDGKVVDAPSLTVEDLSQFRQLNSRRRAIRNTALPLVSRPRPVRSARAAAIPSAWRSRRSGCPRAMTVRASSCSTTT